MKPDVPVIQWQGCYAESWNGWIVPEAFAHPAKFARGLIRRILEHGIERGYWQPGQLIGDPFGGVACGGIVASSLGFRWVGNELEAKFVALGNQNIDLHADWYAIGKPCPVLLRGDSRRFHEIIGQAFADGVLTSPPYAETGQGTGNMKTGSINPEKLTAKSHSKKMGPSCHGEGYGDDPGQIGALRSGSIDAAVSSPPYNLPFSQEHPGNAGGTRGTTPAEKGCFVQYGTDGGQIEGLPNGTVDGAVTSPPYATIAAGQGGLNHLPAREEGQQSGRAKERSQDADTRYGDDPAQIAKLREGGLDAAVTSPPFTTDQPRASQNDLSKGRGKPGDAREHHMDAAENIQNLAPGRVDAAVTSPPYEGSNQDYKAGFATINADPKRIGKAAEANYGDTDGQIGRENGETYWDAMRKVYASLFLALKPGGVAAIVVKDYVKNKKVVPLCEDTMRLLQHVGFEPVEIAHAMLVEHSQHHDLFVGAVVTTKSKKSFFRRLCEKKGSPEINWEEVLFVKKPD